MSYCRFGDADAYIFGTRGRGGVNVIECCGCVIREHVQYTTYADLIRHIKEHRKRGGHIPSYVDERILAELISDDPDVHYLKTGDLSKKWKKKCKKARKEAAK